MCFMCVGGSRHLIDIAIKSPENKTGTRSQNCTTYEIHTRFFQIIPYPVVISFINNRFVTYCGITPYISSNQFFSVAFNSLFNGSVIGADSGVGCNAEGVGVGCGTVASGVCVGAVISPSFPIPPAGTLCGTLFLCAPPIRVFYGGAVYGSPACGFPR